MNQVGLTGEGVIGCCPVHFDPGLILESIVMARFGLQDLFGYIEGRCATK